MVTPAIRTLRVSLNETPLDSFARMRHEPLPFLLGGTDPKATTVMGSRPFAVLVARGDRITIAEGRRIHRHRGNPLEALQELIEAHAVEYSESPLPFCGGAVGYLGYGLRRWIDDVPASTDDDLGFPDLYFAFYDRVITVGPGATTATIVERQPRARPAIPPPDLLEAAVPPVARFTRSQYLRAVTRAKQSITAGDIYEVNLSRRRAEPFDTDPWKIYRRLPPARYACYLPVGDAFLLSASPELFLSVTGRRVVTRPIKGTRPRGRDEREDRRLRTELRRSEKDHAELAMVVDLERNDLGRVCEFGSVQVVEPWTVETHPTLHHLVATIEGRLRPEVSAADLFRATFPGGSVTGCPKIRAMEIIDALEPVQRGVYTGAIGTIGFDGRIEMSVAIRILMLRDGRAVIPVGGAIVADSDPEAEFEETETKALGALGAVTGEAPVAIGPAQR